MVMPRGARGHAAVAADGDVNSHLAVRPPVAQQAAAKSARAYPRSRLDSTDGPRSEEPCTCLLVGLGLLVLVVGLKMRDDVDDLGEGLGHLPFNVLCDLMTVRNR